ncbi:MAG TPA: PadR family transcriptional regulator [Terracidiphilus sp.]|nr:PadR family transcriptional regulator [Terracidiphilus sp.]
MSNEKLTTPDLVLLSLLAERPMHGYEANSLLEARKVRDWAGVSRPQIYYSLDKLAQLGLVEEADAGGEKTGPDRRVFATTEAGRAALADALERGAWTQQLERPPFLTWLALSWQCRPGVFKRQLQRRRDFVRDELQRKQRILEDVLAEVGHPYHEAVWMLSLTLEQLRLELAWLEQVAQEFPRCAAARNPIYDLSTTDL